MNLIWKFGVITAACLASISATAEQPQNLSDLKADISHYFDSGSYDGDVQTAIQSGIVWVESRSAQAGEGEQLAVVLDIDDTALSSRPAQHANGYGFFPVGSCDLLPKGPCGWTGWAALSEAPMIEANRDLYEAAIAAGVTVFFLSSPLLASRSDPGGNLDQPQPIRL